MRYNVILELVQCFKSFRKYLLIVSIKGENLCRDSTEVVLESKKTFEDVITKNKFLTDEVYDAYKLI